MHTNHNKNIAWAKVGLPTKNYKKLIEKLKKEDFNESKKEHWLYFELIAESIGSTILSEELKKDLLAESTINLLMGITREPWDITQREQVYKFIVSCSIQELNQTRLFQIAMENLVDNTLTGDGPISIAGHSDTSFECIEKIIDDWLVAYHKNWDNVFGDSILRGMLIATLKADVIANRINKKILEYLLSSSWLQLLNAAAIVAFFIDETGLQDAEKDLQTTYTNLGSKGRISSSTKDWVINWRNMPAWFDSVWEDPGTDSARLLWAKTLGALIESSDVITKKHKLPKMLV